MNEQTFKKEVMELKQAQKTVLLSSHILSSVEKICDTITIIRQGGIIESGDLSEMRHLTHMEIKVETQSSLANFADTAWAHKVSFENEAKTKAVFSVDHEALGKLMTLLAEKQVVDLTATPPTLEELFIHYYGEVDGDE